MSQRFSLDPAFKDGKPISELLKTNPKIAESLYRKGKDLIMQGRINEGHNYYNKFINYELLPKNTYFWNLKSKALLELGKYEEVLDCLSRLEKRDLKEIAHQLAEKINDQDSENYYAWNNNIGSALFKMKEYTEALHYYNKAIELKPEEPKLWNNKGSALNKLGNYKEAISCYEKAIVLDPLYASAWNNKGLVLIHLGSYDMALKCFEQSINLNPGYAKAWYDKGLILMTKNEFQNAIDSFDKAIEIDPEFKRARIDRERASIYLEGFVPISDLMPHRFCKVTGSVTRIDRGEDFSSFSISDGTGTISVALRNYRQLKLLKNIDIKYNIKIDNCYLSELGYLEMDFIDQTIVTVEQGMHCI